MDRRSYAKIAGSIGVSTIGLAGCLGGNGDGDDTGTDDEEEEFPSEEMRYIVPFGPGGGTDVWARQLMPEMSPTLDQTIAIENIEGADSLRGTGELFYAEPDGHTFGGFNPPATPTDYLAVEDDIEWDITEFEGVGLYSSLPNVMYANPDTGIENLNDLEDAYASGEISILGSLEGGRARIQAELFREYGWDWDEWVTYPGGGPMIQAVASGEVPVGYGSDDAGRSAVQDGTVNVIGVMYSGGSDAYPDAETIVEQGYTDDFDFINASQRGMYAPPDTPRDKTEIISSALEQALNSDAVQAWAEDTGNPISYQGPDEAHQTMLDSIEIVRDRVDIDEMLG